MFYCVLFCVGELLLLIHTSHGQEVVSNLNNTAVLAGNDVTLNCTLHNITSNGQLIIERGGIKMNVDKMESCSVEHDRKGSIGTISLFCPVTKSTDAGRYSCIHTEKLQTASAELIVIDAEPRCSTSYTADSHFITFACDLVFSGGWAPAARWQQLTDNGESVGDPVTNMDMLSGNFTPNRQIRFELPVKVTIETIGAKFRCIIYFDSSQRPSSVSAINVPSYEYVWTSETVRTLPVPVTPISPHQSSEQPGIHTTWIYTLVFVTFGCVLSMFIILVAVTVTLRHHKRQRTIVGKMRRTPITAPDLIRQPDSTLNNSSLPVGESPQSLTSPITQSDAVISSDQTAIEMDSMSEFTNLYAEVVTVSPQTRANPLSIDTSIYASIDHTATVPCDPARGKRSKRHARR